MPRSILTSLSINASKVIRISILIVLELWRKILIYLSTRMRGCMVFCLLRHSDGITEHKQCLWLWLWVLIVVLSTNCWQATCLDLSIYLPSGGTCAHEQQRCKLILRWTLAWQITLTFSTNYFGAPMVESDEECFPRKVTGRPFLCSFCRVIFGCLLLVTIA
jgi:hypothetical protein